MTLSRRDRAACVLAYEWLRSDGGEAVYAINALYGSDHLSKTACDAWGDAVDAYDAVGSIAAQKHAIRIFRARLALLLRATLRADAGDCGPVANPRGTPPCETCSRPAGFPIWHRGAPPGYMLTPLWQSEAINERAAKARERMGK